MAPQSSLRREISGVGKLKKSATGESCCNLHRPIHDRQAKIILSVYNVFTSGPRLIRLSWQLRCEPLCITRVVSAIILTGYSIKTVVQARRSGSKQVHLNTRNIWQWNYTCLNSLFFPLPEHPSQEPKPRFCISFTCHYFIILTQSSWGF